MVEMIIPCLFDYGTGRVQVEVRLRQSDDCSVAASFTPTPPTHAVIKDTCYLESVPGLAPLQLGRTLCHVRRHHESFGSTGYAESFDLVIAQARLEATPPPSASERVTVTVYVTNMLYDRPWNDAFNVVLDGQALSVAPQTAGRVTHIVRIDGIPHGEIANAVDTVRSLCWLVSLATSRLVSIARVEASLGDRLVYRELRSLVEAPQRGLPLVNYHMTAAVEIVRFIEHSFPAYRQYVATYRLNNLITMSILARQVVYQENKVLLMSNFLEVLRYNYAQNVAAPAGTFTQQGDKFFWTTRPSWAAGRTEASFRDILFNFCSEQQITGWSEDFKDIRNEIVHTGELQGVDAYARYLDLHHFCDRVLLALLRWDDAGGAYLPINQPSDPAPNVDGPNFVLFKK